jgi:glycosyltransferase involved in cell wall biosynthesis
MEKILIFSNYLSYSIKFRKEFIEKLLHKNFEVYLVCKRDTTQDNKILSKLNFINSPFISNRINPLFDLFLFLHYKFLLKKIKPSVLFTYTTKPNIYGGLAFKQLKNSFFPTVTGLGSALGFNSILQKILIFFYRQSFKKAKVVIFQNESDLEFMKVHQILKSNYIRVPGSGVNLKEFRYNKPKIFNQIIFLFVGRVIKSKGIDLFLSAARKITPLHKNVKFWVVGPAFKNYINKLIYAQKHKTIKYFGSIKNVEKFYRNSTCLINPTFYPEGISNVILEAQSVGRPVISSNVTGCREIIIEGKNGYLFNPKDLNDLYIKLTDFINLDYNSKLKMGLEGRRVVENNFDRKTVINSYFNLIDK